MPRKIYLVGTFLMILTLCYAKTNQTSNDTVRTKFKILSIVRFHDKPPIATANAFIDELRIASREDVPSALSLEICHLLKVDGVIVLKLLPKTKVLTLNEVFDIYKIQTINRKLIIKVDETVLDYPETLLVSQNQIEKVEIIKGRYIHIILKGYYEKEKERNGEKRVL